MDGREVMRDVGRRLGEAGVAARGRGRREGGEMRGEMDDPYMQLFACG